MSEPDANLDTGPQDDAESSEPEDLLIDLLTGEKQSATPKKLLMQKVLRQLIDGYGFDRADIEINWRHGRRGLRPAKVDIAIFRPGADPSEATPQRIVLCKPQRKREKLRSFTEAEADLRELTLLMENIPDVSLGMWTNGQEDFLLQAESSRFEVRHKPLGVWPVPGELTSDLAKTGGVIQISAEAEDLENTLQRCRQYLNRNLGLDHKDCFKQLAVLLLAKVYDETLPPGQRKFWIRGDEPFTADGQAAIDQRVRATIDDAKAWQPHLLASGWTLDLAPDQTSRVVMELARYSFAATQPLVRTRAFRAIASNVMDGREGRYPTPLNVAEMAVNMLDPQPNQRVMDCSCGTGTFLAIAAAHIFSKNLPSQGTEPAEASSGQLEEARTATAHWAAANAFGCDIDPFLAVTSRMNLMFTASDPGNVFRLDARTFPDGDLDGVARGRSVAPLGSMDIVLLNPWFSTKDVVTDESILDRFELGYAWEADETGAFRNTGKIASSGIPPEVLFIERALQWVKPNTGRVAILLPDGLLGNPSDEYIRWWILRRCEVLASVDLPIEPFKVTVKAYGLTPALPSLLVLRRRGDDELIRPTHPDYKVFMAVVDRAGVDARGNLLFRRAPDGEELVFEDEVIERVRAGDDVTIRRVTRRLRHIHDELPTVAEKFHEFLTTGAVSQ